MRPAIRPRNRRPFFIRAAEQSGQVSIPRAILRRLGITGGQILLVETSADGSIVLKPVGAYPLEIYGPERLRQFEKADRRTAAESNRLRRKLAQAPA